MEEILVAYPGIYIKSEANKWNLTDDTPTPTFLVPFKYNNGEEIWRNAQILNSIYVYIFVVHDKCWTKLQVRKM